MPGSSSEHPKHSEHPEHPHRRALPRLVVAAPASGQGKTTIATGLMAALRLAGVEVSGHKVGPDYIDPGFHAMATGRPGHNLDPHLVGTDRIVPLLLHGSAGADIAIIEGVMGLYDGRLGTGGFASTAHVARLTGSPVVLVLDVTRMSRTVAAIAAGMAAYDDTITIGGVILNRTGSARNDAEIVAAMERTGLPILGNLPRDEQLATPSRHLGLVPAAERDSSVALLHRLGEQVAQRLDLPALLELARSAPVLDADPWDPTTEVHPAGAGRPVIAMAGGRAFTFRYAETETLLQAAGCDVVDFDPITDPGLPEGTQGIYLGGGFPEVYAAELAANRSLLADLRAAVASGIPTVAECAGLLYLAETLDGAPMGAVLPATAAMTGRLTLRYPTATAVSDSLLTRAGEQVTGHEFHRTQTTPVHSDAPAWDIDGSTTGFTTDNLHASYLHVHWAGYPHVAQRFADAAHAATPHHAGPARPDLVERPDRVESPAEPAPPETTGPKGTPPGDPLRHHGDAETGTGLLDCAVNVYDGPRPDWLEAALHESLADARSYPDPAPATAAIAQAHRRQADEVLPTAGSAEAFGLIARLRPWRKPVVVHPQFTEPHVSLQLAGHQVTTVLCRPETGFAVDPVDVPEDADLVVIGNPTNPTGVLHPADRIIKLLRRGRLVVVDEAFMDVVPDQRESLVREQRPDLVVLRSLTKHWSIPGIRAGYLVGPSDVVGHLARQQTPWSVSSPAIAALIACHAQVAATEARRRALAMSRWRDLLEGGLLGRGITVVPSSASFVLARLPEGAHAELREHGVAVRRADTFPGLDSRWVRIAVRPPETTARFLAVLDQVCGR
ncbi:MAG: cobyrinic acid a,c-diamide synthase [Actinomycetales bacterium]|nr:MAG: cobyrinic acid a,c-diamide synthase [Actinomycetales bacterium]